MAFKLKSALKFGQKGVFKQKTYNSPNKQKKIDWKKEISEYEFNSKKDPNYPYKEKTKEQMDGDVKEWLMTNRGFNQEDADRMIADGAYTYKDMIIERFKDIPAEPKGKGSEGKALKRLPKDLYDHHIKKSPNKQKNPELQESEHEDTWIYEGDDIGERINDLEDRIEFINEDIFNQDDKPTEAQKKTKAKLQKELDALYDHHRKSTPNKHMEEDDSFPHEHGPDDNIIFPKGKKKSPNKQVSQEDWQPAYEGGDWSWDDLREMGEEEIKKRWPDEAQFIIKDLLERAKNKKQYKKEDEKSSPNKQGLIIDEQTEDWLKTLTTPNPSEEEKERARKAKIEYDKKYSKKNKKKIDSPTDGGTLPEVTVKPKSSPNKQEGPIPKKNIKLQPGEMEGSYLYGHNYGDEDIPGKGEGFEPTGTRDQKHTANERINDLEERAWHLLDNDLESSDEYLGGGDAAKGAKRRKVMEKTVKKLLHEADIMRKRRENERKSAPTKQNFIWDEESQKRYDQLQGYGESDREYKKRLRKMVKEGDMEKKDFRKKKKQIRKSKRQDRKSEKNRKKTEEARKVPKPVKSPPKFWQKEEYQENSPGKIYDKGGKRRKNYKY